MRTSVAAAFFLSLCLLARARDAAPNNHGQAQHVVLIVWDGMRPDFINDELTPNLTTLARDGVFFRHNHSSFPTSTNVNGAVLATGDYPGHNGLISNHEFRPAIDPLQPFDTADFAALDARDQVVNATYLHAPTVAETVQRAGFRTAVAGAKPVAQLADRSRKRGSAMARESAVIFRGKVLPQSAEAAITRALGPFPKRTGPLPNIAEDKWTTRALTEVLWKDGVPKFSLLWLSEPDLTQHETAPGSPRSLEAIKSSDDNLGRVVAALRAKGALPTTDIMVVSDHGFSTVGRSFDLAKELENAGFDAHRAFQKPPHKGQVLVVSLGGSSEFYVVGHDSAVISKLVDYLQRSDFAGVILTRKQMSGAFTLAQLHCESLDAPDILITGRWNNEPNEYKINGAVNSDIGKKAGQGTHSTLSPYDLHNTLVAGGPDFRHGWNDPLPTGNIDVAPTILWLLGIKPERPMDGRVLREGLTGAPTVLPRAQEQTLRAERSSPANIWWQTLRLTSLSGVTYFNEGNGSRQSESVTQPSPAGSD